MAGKINLALIVGGQNSEHEVSLNSGVSILNALDKNKYNIKIIKIEKSGKWLVGPYIKELPAKSDLSVITNSVKGITPLEDNTAIGRMDDEKVDVAFIGMHGKYGEDGKIQALLEFAGIPYQGSGVSASALGMDKIKSAELFRANGLNVPGYLSFNEKSFKEDKGKITEFLKNNLPLVLKPSDEGSSAGTFLIKTPEDFEQRLPETFKVSKNAVLQEYIKGDEVTCGILDTDEKPVALPPTQIIANSGEFYDYASKYASGGSTHIVPAPFAPELVSEIQNTALKAHKILGCSGLSRTDMLIRDGKIYVLETNTLPGFTSTSLFPEEAEAAGISYSELLDKLIRHALNKGF